ncbi:MAG: DUF58 domain-containing protein [Planctomycetota bacterium]|nr:DUF58 domain-containing protein [Planctomycetota bacterium]
MRFDRKGRDNVGRSQRVSVTREGWYYLFILTFIVGGAVMRQINPLFALAGLMIAPILFNWRFSMASLRHIDFSRRLPHRIAAGEPLVVDLELTNERARLDAWQVCITDDVRWQGTTRSRSHEVEVLVPGIAAGGHVRTSYRCQLYRRGRYHIGPTQVRCSYPFGLISIRSKKQITSQLLVSPRMGFLQRNWRRLIHAQRSGDQSSRQRKGSTDGDFYSLRQYRNGDSRRWIHWRTSAKLGELMVQQFDESTDQHVAIFVDLWEPEELTAADLDAVELAASFAATAAVDLCRGNSGKLTFSVSGETPFFHTGAASKPLLNTVLDHLATARSSSRSHPFEHGFQTANVGMQGTTVLLVSTRPPELLETILRSDSTSTVPGPNIPDRFHRISVLDPEFAHWFSISNNPMVTQSPGDKGSANAPKKPAAVG